MRYDVEVAEDYDGKVKLFRIPRDKKARLSGQGKKEAPKAPG